MGGPFFLSLTEVDILAQLLGANVRQFPFQIPSVGRLQVDRTRIAREVFADLGRRGLIRGRDVDPDLERAMRTLSEPVIAVAVLGTVNEREEIYARASAAGETGVLARLIGQKMRIELIRPTALAVSLVGLLPKLDGGPGQSVTINRPGAPVPVRAGADQGGDQSLFRPVSGSGGVDQRLRLAASYLNRPRTGTGFFAVSGRDRHGREQRAGGLTWMDTDAGRYLSLSRPPAEDGSVSSTFSPADNNRLVHALGEMIESVAPRR
ncbi:ESX secretion-associated protein EspG [Actinophytocola gossypii]|uniref:ESX secretion-associated protein EspG n=1 Tax=Actinophytocola gossypii TaxID=2812003 RepID=A0ABT2JDG7_9PSEU|nr:ESX secretion-associated protein EspG [Actinophytocola gossypii]MCT2585921.1 ESX secretion-associated protein EspG [Actinophytocola gossypii]